MIDKGVPCPGCKRLYCCATCKREDWRVRHCFDCGLDTSFKLVDLALVDEPILGKGSYGEVRLVRHLLTNQLYALKTINKKLLQRQSALQVFLREVQIHKALEHPRVIKLYSHMEDEDNVYLLLEYASNSNLFRNIKEAGRIEEERAKKYFKQTCEGLKFLHDMSIVHRDLKPENILLSDDYDIKICDFGWSFKGTETRTTFCGTLDYMAPEMLRGLGHSAKVDVWAIGVLLYEMLHGYPPFNSKDELEKSRQIGNADYRCDFYVSRKAADLISRLLVKEPAERLTLEEILNHPWLLSSKYSQMIITTPSEEASNEFDLLSNIELWCKTPAKRKRNLTTVVDDIDDLNTIVSKQSGQVDVRQSRLERQSSVKDFEVLTEHVSKIGPKGVFSDIERRTIVDTSASKTDRVDRFNSPLKVEPTKGDDSPLRTSREAYFEVTPKTFEEPLKAFGTPQESFEKPNKSDLKDSKFVFRSKSSAKTSEKSLAESDRSPPMPSAAFQSFDFSTVPKKPNVKAENSGQRLEKPKEPIPSNAKPHKIQKAKRDYEASRQEIEDSVSKFYTSVSETWIKNREVEVIRAPELRFADYSDVPSRRKYLSSDSSNDEAALPIPESKAKFQAVKVKPKKAKAVPKRGKSRVKSRPRRKIPSRETSPVNFTPRVTYNQPKPLRQVESSSGFFTWLGSMFGCTDRY